VIVGEDAFGGGGEGGRTRTEHHPGIGRRIVGVDPPPAEGDRRLHDLVGLAGPVDERVAREDLLDERRAAAGHADHEERLHCIEAFCVEAARGHPGHRLSGKRVSGKRLPNRLDEPRMGLTEETDARAAVDRPLEPAALNRVLDRPVVLPLAVERGSGGHMEQLAGLGREIFPREQRVDLADRLVAKPVVGDGRERIERGKILWVAFEHLEELRDPLCRAAGGDEVVAEVVDRREVAGGEGERRLEVGRRLLVAVEGLERERQVVERLRRAGREPHGLFQERQCLLGAARGHKQVAEVDKRPRVVGRFRKRQPQQRLPLRLPAELLEEHGNIIEQIDVVTGDRKRRPHHPLRLGKPAETHEHEAEAVGRVGRSRRRSDGAAEHLLGLGEPAEILQHDAEVVERGGVGGVEPDSRLERRDGLGEPASLCPHHAEPPQGMHVLRIGGARRGDRLLGRRRVAGLAEQRGEVLRGSGVGGSEPDRLAELSDRLLAPAERPQRDREVRPVGRVRGHEPHRLADEPHRVVVPPLLLGDHAEQLHRVGPRGVGREDPLVDPTGLDDTAGLVEADRFVDIVHASSLLPETSTSRSAMSRH